MICSYQLTIMLTLFLWSCISHLAHAAAIYNHAQQPLSNDALETPEEYLTLTVLPLVFNDIDKFILPSIDRSTGHPTLGVLQNTRTYVSPYFPYSVLIYVPHDAPVQKIGTAVVTIEGAASSSKDWGNSTWLDFDGAQANRIPLSSVGVRNGGKLVKEVQSARLALDTPYISIPNEVFGVVLQASRAEWDREEQSDKLLVDCGALDMFPDLVFGLEKSEEEIIVTPRQYVLRERGKCTLLVRGTGDGSEDEVVLGWAAIRGREFVLDWVVGKMGFGAPWPWSSESEQDSEGDIEY